MDKLTTVLLLCATNLLAQSPVLHSVLPRGIPPGTTTELRLVGERLENITTVWTSLSDAQVSVCSNSTVLVRAPKHAAGIAGLRVATSNGASELVMFVVDAL